MTTSLPWNSWELKRQHCHTPVQAIHQQNCSAYFTSSHKVVTFTRHPLDPWEIPGGSLCPGKAKCYRVALPSHFLLPTSPCASISYSIRIHSKITTLMRSLPDRADLHDEAPTAWRWLTHWQLAPWCSSPWFPWPGLAPAHAALQGWRQHCCRHRPPSGCWPQSTAPAPPAAWHLWSRSSDTASRENTTALKQFETHFLSFGILSSSTIVTEWVRIIGNFLTADCLFMSLHHVHNLCPPPPFWSVVFWTC